MSSVSTAELWALGFTAVITVSMMVFLGFCIFDSGLDAGYKGRRPVLRRERDYGPRRHKSRSKGRLNERDFDFDDASEEIDAIVREATERMDKAARRKRARDQGISDDADFG